MCPDGRHRCRHATPRSELVVRGATYNDNEDGDEDRACCGMSSDKYGAGTCAGTKGRGDSVRMGARLELC